jgi:hypothetical protein
MVDFESTALRRQEQQGGDALPRSSRQDRQPSVGVALVPSLHAVRHAAITELPLSATQRKLNVTTCQAAHRQPEIYRARIATEKNELRPTSTHIDERCETARDAK